MPLGWQRDVDPLEHVQINWTVTVQHVLHLANRNPIVV